MPRQLPLPPCPASQVLQQGLRPWLALLALATAAGLPLSGAQAQIYRSVNSAGQVSFSDRPSAGAQALSERAAGATATANALPYDLGQVVQRYPATLYSGPACEPCARARQLLQQRGVPFAEKTVSSAQDLQALQSFNPERSLPVLGLGAHKRMGFNPEVWHEDLDLAGYPRVSMLPASYRAAPASPLVPLPAPSPASLAPATQVPAANGSAPASVAPAPGYNPAGIRF